MQLCRHFATIRPFALVPGMNHAQFSNGGLASGNTLLLRLLHSHPATQQILAADARLPASDWHPAPCPLPWRWTQVW